MLGNVIDARSTSEFVERFDFVLEPSWHDNGAGQFQWPRQSGDTRLECEELLDATFAQAIERVNSWSFPVTIYVYDQGDDPLGTRKREADAAMNAPVVSGKDA